MNSENEKYTALINRIKAEQAQIPDTQRLTQQTMQRIENLPQKKTSNKMFQFVSWTSSIAASLLIGLFVLEQSLPSNNIEYQSNMASVPVLPTYDKQVLTEKITVLTQLNALMQLKKEYQQKTANS